MYVSDEAELDSQVFQDVLNEDSNLINIDRYDLDHATVHPTSHIPDDKAAEALNRLHKIPGIDLASIDPSRLTHYALHYAKHWREKADLPFGIKYPHSQTKAAAEAKLDDLVWWTRQLRKVRARASELAAYELGLVGAHGYKYASDAAVDERARQLRATEQYLSTTRVRNGTKELTLADCTRNDEQKFAELYMLIKSLERRATSEGKAWMFLTLTAPARMHPSPAKGANTWDGTTPKQAHQWLSERWHRILALLSKRDTDAYGFRVVEPHRDGAPHWHILVFCDSESVLDVADAVSRHFRISHRTGQTVSGFAASATNESNANIQIEYSTAAALGIDEQFQIQIPHGKSEASAASYVAKYAIKTSDDSPESKRVDAWRSVWNIRAYQAFGIKRGLTKWREMRRISEEPTESLAAAIHKIATQADDACGANVFRFDSFLSFVDRIKYLKEEYINRYGEIKKKIVGIAIHAVDYVTHGGWELIKETAVAVIPNYSREDETSNRLNGPGRRMKDFYTAAPT